MKFALLVITITLGLLLAGCDVPVHYEWPPEPTCYEEMAAKTPHDTCLINGDKYPKGVGRPSGEDVIRRGDYFGLDKGIDYGWFFFELYIGLGENEDPVAGAYDDIDCLLRGEFKSAYEPDPVGLQGFVADGHFYLLGDDDSCWIGTTIINGVIAGRWINEDEEGSFYGIDPFTDQYANPW